jgi:hypothetical protein
MDLRAVLRDLDSSCAPRDQQYGSVPTLDAHAAGERHRVTTNATHAIDALRNQRGATVMMVSVWFPDRMRSSSSSVMSKSVASNDSFLCKSAVRQPVPLPDFRESEH